MPIVAIDIFPEKKFADLCFLDILVTFVSRRYLMLTATLTLESSDPAEF